MREAETLAEKLLQESEVKKKAGDRSTLVDADLDRVSLRDKIFMVCSMLYEQQKQAGLQLATLETKVKHVRQEFTCATLRRNTWESKASIDKLFEKA